MYVQRLFEFVLEELLFELLFEQLLLEQVNFPFEVGDALRFGLGVNEFAFALLD